MNKKPITDNILERCKKLFYFLKVKRTYVTKEEIARKLGLKSERSARDVISTLAKRHPIISTSDGKGYKLAVNIRDLKEVEHMWKEIDSRIDELEARKKPLIDFYEKAKTILRERNKDDL